MIDLDFDTKHIWHPYTSMHNPLPTYPVKEASGVHIFLEDGTKLIDGMSSWWSVIHGYNHPVINHAITTQLHKMSHVMFGGLTHEPAVELCKKLVAMTPEGLNKVFLADSGSVAVEVAMKMAIQCQLGRGFTGKTKFITIKQGYHGDTFGAMSVCDPVNSMHSLYSDTLAKHYFVDAPLSKFGETFNQSDLISVKKTIIEHHDDIAAFILEPIVQGAGGMRFYHPQFLSEIKKLCQQYDILLIADEIATGFGRTGKLFACEHARICPDIICLGKALTGGYMTLAATLCTDDVANMISQCEAGVLMHGPTFMANPLACAAANASMDLLHSGDWQQQVNTIEQGLQTGLEPCKAIEAVQDVRVLGAIGVVEMIDPVDVALIQKYFVQQGVWVRPFGRLVYVMPQYCISSQELKQLCDAIVNVLTSISD